MDEKNLYAVLRPSTLVDMANDISAEIDSPDCNDKSRQHLVQQFNEIADQLRLHGGDEFLVMNIRCPWNITFDNN